MKKILTLFTALVAMFQILNAQTNPALLTNFKIDENPVTGYELSWHIANNELVHKFDVQKSTNGKDFTTIAVLSASHKSGAEIYSFKEQSVPGTKVMYRIKTISPAHLEYYSNIIMVSAKTNTNEQFSILGNPVVDKLSLRFNESSKQPFDVRVYNLTGRAILDLKINNVEKNNIVAIPISSTGVPGIYIVEINNGTDRMIAKFIKQ